MSIRRTKFSLKVKSRKKYYINILVHLYKFWRAGCCKWRTYLFTKRRWITRHNLFRVHILRVTVVNAFVTIMLKLRKKEKKRNNNKWKIGSMCRLKVGWDEGLHTRIPCILDIALSGLRALRVRIVLKAWIPPAPQSDAMKLMRDTCERQKWRAHHRINEEEKEERFFASIADACFNYFSSSLVLTVGKTCYSRAFGLSFAFANRGLFAVLFLGCSKERNKTRWMTRRKMKVCYLL